MIMEIARITLKSDAAEEFLAVATEHGLTIFKEATGCRGMQLRRSIESPNDYVMIVYWETLDNHLVDFRESEGLKLWRELTTPLYAAPTRIENFEVAVEGFGVMEPASP